MPTTAASDITQFFHDGEFIQEDEARRVAENFATMDMWDMDELEAYWRRMTNQEEDVSERMECAEILRSLTRDRLEIFLPE